MGERVAGTNGLKAIVIGGGIGGVTTAYALNKQGMEAEVYEQADDLRKIYVGSGIHMWNNAMRALKEIGLAKAVEDATGPDAVRWARPDRSVRALLEFPRSPQHRRSTPVSATPDVQ